MQKYIFLGLLSTVLTVACNPSSNDSESPSSTGAKDEGGTVSLRSDVDTGSSSSGPAVSGSSSSGTNPPEQRYLEDVRFVSMEEAEQRVDLVRMCDFKDEHIVETVSFSGQDIIVKGSEEPSEISEIIKERTWWRAWLKGDLVADFERAGRQVIPEGGGGGIVAVYFYDRDEQYGYWCPSEEQEECIVQVIYRGAIQRRDGSAVERDQIPVENKGNSPTQERLIQRRAGSKVTDGEGFLSDWQYTGDLKVQIHFSGRVLNFSRCSGTAD